ncbi:hypothetical protein K461DRAFT_290853 [Myriangium duriaei CBS 260.36]|uniref:60S ribosomal subunit assembly/export protein LOC1 n=1 Tax=Myriangium duriaei CBS 260.36 TaxID=1168546 RepID=A0A9P4J6N8_9PEZI|nr:hypothetical protein K461DRAFT_290853 [Myriangium duriaei CBS 260.36]
MAPTKGGKPAPSKSKGKSSGKSSSKVTKSGSSASKGKKSGPVKATQQKTKPTSHRPDKKKKRVYTEKELGIPTLNSIKPAGVLKPNGTKKGKTFVDDKEGMMAILAMVQAEKEGDIESKIMRARQMEEVREAKRAEAERREGEKKRKFEEVKDEVRRANGDKRKRKQERVTQDEEAPKTKSKKRVSFG